jgi:repressor of nif and glnA expression
MAKPIPKNDLNIIKDILKSHPEGVRLKLISEALAHKIPNRTLRYHLRYLKDKGMVVTQGERPATKS